MAEVVPSRDRASHTRQPRPRWIQRDEFVRRFAGRQADPKLAVELRDLAKDTTDDLDEP